MIEPPQMFKSDPGHIFDFSGKSPADIFNQHVVPVVNQFASLLDQPNPTTDFVFDPYRPPATAQPDLGQYAVPSSDSTNYDAPLPPQRTETSVDPEDAKNPQALGFVPTNLKLANYGYASDTTPDFNSNVKKIGHANNPLVDGYSAALTKSLAKKHGLKTGDEFEVLTADGKVLRRRYDDTVPSIYKGRKLPETVDLYEVGGSNKFGGKVVGIRPLTKRTDLPQNPSDATDLVLPPKN